LRFGKFSNKNQPLGKLLIFKFGAQKSIVSVSKPEKAF